VTAAEICSRFDVPSDAWSLIDDTMGPLEFVDALMANKQYVAGIDFIAHALTARDAVWWGGLCFQHAYGDDLSVLDKDACRAAIRWVLEPSEENRAAARAPAEAAGPMSAAGRLAMAVIHTGGTIAPKGAPTLPADPFAPAKAVAAAVKLASITSDPVKIADTQRLFVELGIDIGLAQGRLAEPAELLDTMED
jgi:hypothetical protein